MNREMNNPEFQFNFKFKLHKSCIPIGLPDEDYARLSVAYGVELAEMMQEVAADDQFLNAEAAKLMQNYPEAARHLAGKRIAFLGDSITSDRASYFNIIRRALEAEGICFHDGSISGYKLLDVITNYVPALTDFHADAAHIMLGSNDMKRTTDGANFQLVEPEEFRRELRYLLNALKAQGMKRILSTLPPFDAKKVHAKFWAVNVGYSEEDRRAFNAVIREEAAENGCMLNDMEETYARYSTDELTRDDGLHLNELGQRLMANAVMDFLMKV